MAIRTFLIYAEEDYRFRDQFLGQVQSSKMPVELTDMPNKQPWVPRWKTACRTRAFESDGAIVFISHHTRQGAGVKFELECVLETQIPVLGVRIEKCEAGAVPEELRGVRIIDWNWPEIAQFLKSLGSASGARA